MYMGRIFALIVFFAFLLGCAKQQAPQRVEPQPAAPASSASPGTKPAEPQPSAKPPQATSPSGLPQASPPTALPPAKRQHDRKHSESLSADRSPASVENPAPAPPPPTTQDPDALLEQAADNLPLGQVAVNHPQQMKVSQPDTVQVRISRDQQAQLSSDLSAGQVAAHDTLPISTSMKVTLVGAPYFDVKNLDRTEQLITHSGYSQWSFTVTPLQSGKLPLHVRISAVVRAGGVEKSKDFPVKDEIIEVSVSPMAAMQTFVANNWQWLWSTILVPVGAWAWSQRRRKNKKALAAKASANGKSQGQAAKFGDG